MKKGGPRRPPLQKVRSTMDVIIDLLPTPIDRNILERARKSTAMKMLLTCTSILFACLPVVASESGQETALPMRDFDRRMDTAHANCASKDLEFSVRFYECLDRAMEGIYIDSSTVFSRR